MKKRRLICLVLLLCILLQNVAVPAQATAADETTGAATDQIAQNIQPLGNDQSVVSGSHTADAQRPILGSDKMLDTAGAAMLYEVNSDTVMYAWNPDQTMYPASLVKIMTALLALENGDLTSVVTVSANAMAALNENNATLQMQVGETLTLEQLLYCLLVGGANDAAVVIADHIAGSQQGFVQMMNDRAKALGCNGTVFTNPHGLHEDPQVTTARDMVKILREAMKHETFNTIFGTVSYTLPATSLSEERYMETTNFMMTPSTVAYYDKRVTGGRTGVTTDRLRCLIVSAQSGGMNYISVILGAVPTFDVDGYTPKYFGSYEETRELLKVGFEGFEVKQVLQEQQVLLQYPVANASSNVAAGPARSVSTVLPQDFGYENLSVVYQHSVPALTAPVKNGQQINTVQLWYGTICVAESPVIALNDATGAVNISDHDSGNGGNSGLTAALIVIGIIVGAVGIFVGVVWLYRFLRITKERRKQRNRRLDRRRSK